MKLRNRSIPILTSDISQPSTSVVTTGSSKPSTKRKSKLSLDGRSRESKGVAASGVRSKRKGIEESEDGWGKEEKGGEIVEAKKVKVARLIGISDVPDHLLVWTFEQLAIVDRIKVERVCRRWLRLARFHSWSKTNSFCYASLLQQTTCTPWRCIDDRPKVGNTEMRSILNRAGTFLHSVDLSAFRDSLNYSVCSSIGHFCVDLQTLCLTGIQLTNSSLNLIARYCPDLRSVNLQRCFQESVIERGLSGFLAKCQRLTLLDVSENERLCGAPSFSNLPGSLRTLVIAGCFRLSGQAIDQIRRRCGELSVLAMDGVDMVTPDELNALFEPLTSLRTLKFGECFVTSVPGGTELTNLGRLRDIRELVLNDNLLITNDALAAIGSGCKLLETLDISGCNRSVTDDGVRELAKLPNLTHLNISLLRSVTDDGVRTLARCSKLQSFLMHRCDQLTDASLLMIAKSCQDLIKVDISYCPLMTDTALWALFRLVNARADKRRLKVWIARSGATVPSPISHPLLDFNDSDHIADNSLSPLLLDIW
uniref:F-box domain-containing protein n=1 Tax=Plectus sambesii TaxID=2011161 RepID=A0A914XJ30_9BILA